MFIFFQVVGKSHQRQEHTHLPARGLPSLSLMPKECCSLEVSSRPLKEELMMFIFLIFIPKLVEQYNYYVLGNLICIRN